MAIRSLFSFGGLRGDETISIVGSVGERRSIWWRGRSMPMEDISIEFYTDCDREVSAFTNYLWTQTGDYCATDNLEQYREYVKQLITGYANSDQNKKEVEVKLIMDTVRDHYQWMNVGCFYLRRSLPESQGPKARCRVDSKESSSASWACWTC